MSRDRIPLGVHAPVPPGAFGWKSQPAIERVRQAVSEIKTVARRDPVLGAEGSSSGAIGTAANHAIEELLAVIVRAPADAKTREGWLERLWDAHANDEIPYIERLGGFWGDLCRSPEIASAWAERLVPITKTSTARRSVGVIDFVSSRRVSNSMVRLPIDAAPSDAGCSGIEVPLVAPASCSPSRCQVLTIDDLLRRA